MKHTAEISEIFSSIQGEGPRFGERMTFVRFARCSMGCRYCDTPHGLCGGKRFRVESLPGSGKFESFENPVGAARLCEMLACFEDETISITGGEPLEQAGFLAEWLPAISHSKRILLETNGIHVEALSFVLPFVHVVSMDIKLPSSSGGRALWREHEAFLRAAVASPSEIYVKIVVCSETTDRDLADAIGLVARTNRFIPVVIQPASQTLSFNSPASSERIEAISRLCRAWLPDVRVIPQMHKHWGVL